MTDFVLEQEHEIPRIPNLPKVVDMDRLFVQRIILYARFLKQPLELWMFIPCKLVDGVWLVLENPFSQKGFEIEKKSNSDEWFEYCKEYQQAKERVLFEGKFQVLNNYNTYVRLNNIEFNLHGLTIERMVPFNLELTATAQKQIGL